mmetsp:Transcript_20530/g.43017  ORF Transcript_20530/g.43017 Transcript_20530/m.43017 type:complete len:1459 (-) Transcript_20530:62-4438(-)
MPDGSILDRAHHVWFPHKPTVWALGSVTSSVEEEDVMTVEYEGKEYRVKKDDTEEFDPTHLENHPDVATLNNLNQAPLLDLLKRRYYNDEIYTNVANISISFNPYKWIDGLYANPTDPKYTRKGKDRIPHVYSVANAAYDLLVNNKKDQSVIVSGESGAGKTEACKKVMTFLAETSSNIGSSSSTGTVATVEQRVMDCNPFLEAFGNAKTVRNDNSSRFGKFIKIEYQNKKITGASMCHYLLEKSRVVKNNPGERNYHIFYQLLSGATSQQLASWNLTKASDYNILNQGALTIDNVDDKQEFKEVLRALDTVGAKREDVEIMLQLLAGILHLGNVEFEVDEHENSQIKPSSRNHLKHAMNLLQCGVLDIKLTTRIVKAKGRKSVYTVPLKLNEALEARDALAKAVYDNLFTHLIVLCNNNLHSESSIENFIGILDIFGFEIFKINSFEQLCINFANEKLQSLFNHTVFISEQENYASEGIDCAYIEFQNNQPCVDLIEKKPSGLLPLLDEICVLNRKTDTDMTYLTTLNNTHRGKTKHYGVSRFAGNNTFIVKHFAGDVIYSVEGFISKNNDKLLPDLESAMLTSKSPFIKSMFENAKQIQTASIVSTKARSASVSSMGKTPTTIGYNFKNQLAGLYQDILSTNPHYIRCVKPNNNKSPHDFDAPMVMDQLKCNGTLEMVRIRREGYPMREEWEDLWPIVLKFEYWKEAHVDPKLPAKVGCKAVFDKALPKGYYQVAKSGKVFLKHDTYHQLEVWKMNTNAVFIQSKYRSFSGRKNYKLLRLRIIMLQRGIGGFMARQKYKKHVAKITKCQASIRMFVTMKILFKRKKAIKVLDSRLHAYVVGKKAKREFEEAKASVNKLQALQRGRKGRKQYEELRYQKLVVEEQIKKEKMATVINTRFKKKTMTVKLEAWVQEAFTAASWGEIDPLKNLVNCSSKDWAVLRGVKKDLCNVRDRMDGMKSLLHVVAINGNEKAVKLLIDGGANVNVIDCEGNTPLHRSAGCGDTHLAVSKLLVENCSKKSVGEMVNLVNGEKFTALDVALAEGAEGDEGSTETVKLLLKYGAQSAKGTGKGDVEKLIEVEKKKKQEKQEKEAKMEQLKLEAARQERERDPHFQFLKIQSGVGDTKVMAEKLEKQRKEQQAKEEEEKRKKVQDIQKKRVMRRTSTRQSIFQSGGLLGKLERNNSTGSTGSGGLPGAKEMDKISTEAGMAESKQDPNSPNKATRKVKRRVSAKVVDNTWAVKSNVPYRQLAKSVIGGAGGVTDEAGDKAEESESRDGESRDGSRATSMGSVNSAAHSSIRESIAEEEEEEAEEVAVEDVVASVEETAGEVLPPVPPEVAEEEKHLAYETACGYSTTLVKLTQMIQDASTEQARRGWYYLNADNGEEGPFHAEWMHSWLSDKALNGDTQIRCGDGLNFVLLSSLIPDHDNVTMETANPFDLSWSGEIEASVNVLESLSGL